MNQIKALISDLGRVIVHFDHGRTYQAAAEITGLSRSEISRKLIASGLIYRYDKGEFSDAGFYNMIMELFEFDRDVFSFEQFCRMWGNIFWPNKEMIDTLTELKTTLRLAMLSNTNGLHFKAIESGYPEMLKLFEGRLTLSHKVKIMKPDPRIYHAALDSLRTEDDSINFENCVYVDDLEENTAAAEKLGMHGITYNSHNDFLERMEQLLRS